MKKLHLILLSLLTVSLIIHCPASSSGNPTNGTQLPAPTDITPIKMIHAHVNDNVDNATVINLAASITVTEPTYSILEGNDDNIFSIDSSTGVITLPDASKVTYDASTKTNNIHLLKVQVRNGSDTTKATEAPLRIVVRGENGAFITTWTVEDSDKSITIPTTGSGYNFTVAWGDDSANETITMHNDASLMDNAATNTYATAGTYTVVITSTFPRIHFNNAGDKTKIKTVEQWGSTAWSSMENAFYGAENLTVPAVDAPNLTVVTSMQFMFRGATVFNQDINHWDTSNIRNMSAMFRFATAFNQDVGSWNTAMVTNMSGMFSVATAFNQDIGTNGDSWNTAKVENMNRMFTDAFAFNQDISSWNTAKVTDMSNMFNDTRTFNQDISSWNTAKVTTMSNMFSGATAFNQAIGTSANSWNTAKVTDMSGMFFNATAFNQDISGWNTGMVTDMSFMFSGATAFNQNISGWTVGAVTNCGSFAAGDSVLANSNLPDFMNPPDCSP